MYIRIKILKQVAGVYVKEKAVHTHKDPLFTPVNNVIQKKKNGKIKIEKTIMT
jgi:hypothetical protein